MTSLEKCKLLIELDKKKSIAKIVTVHGEEFICKLNGFAEDEKDWAYHVMTLDYPPRFFILECNYIESIEEIESVESKQLENKKRRF